MRDYLGEEFEGVISGVTSFGFFVETVAQKCEGLVSINSLTDFDDFRLIESDYSLVGLRSGRRFGMGDKVWIKVVAANLDKRQLDYEWVLKPEACINQPNAKPQEEAVPAKETKQPIKIKKVAAGKIAIEQKETSKVAVKKAPAKKAPAAKKTTEKPAAKKVAARQREEKNKQPE